MPNTPIYKYIFIFLILAVPLLSFRASAQGRGGITIEPGPHRLETVLRLVESQSRYDFAYNSEEISLDARVNASFNNLPLRKALNAIFDNTIYEYNIIRRHITLSLRKGVRKIDRLPAAPYYRAEIVVPQYLDSYAVPEITWHERKIVAVLKTNSLKLLAGTFNLGAEFRLGDRWTMNLEAGYNPWSFGTDVKWRHFVAKAEARYWFSKAFNGWFAGFGAGYYDYEIGHLDLPFVGNMRRKEYRGHALGGTVGVGYYLAFNHRWGIEFSGGANFLRAKHDKYFDPTAETGWFRGVLENRKETLILPSFGISFTYRIK